MQKSKLFYLHFYDFGLTEWAFSLRVYFFEDDDIDAGETTAMLCWTEHHREALFVIIRLWADGAVEFDMLLDEASRTHIIHVQ